MNTVLLGLGLLILVLLVNARIEAVEESQGIKCQNQPSWSELIDFTCEPAAR